MVPSPATTQLRCREKMFRAALKSALAMKLKENQLNVVDAFTLENHKTKAFAKALAKLGFDRKVLLVDHQENPNLWLAARNLSDVQLLPNLQVTPYHVLNAQARGVHEGGDSGIAGGADEMSTIYDVIKRPIITEKGLTLKENDRTLCFEVDDNASKQQIQEAVEQLFKVKVQQVRTMVVPGKMRRRGKYTGYRSDWKKAYVTLREGEKMIEYGENF